MSEEFKQLKSRLTPKRADGKTPPVEADQHLHKYAGTSHGRDLCMLGGIYSDERCPVCGGSYRDDGRRGLFCPDHPEHSATKFKVIFKGLCKRFRDYQSAQRLLTGLRYKIDEGSFDERDYRMANPLGFETLALQFLEVKKGEVKKSSYRKIQNHVGRAVSCWGQKNIKEIGYAEIEDFLLAQKLEGKEKPISTKTRANVKGTLHSFWSWLHKRRILTLAQLPEFPEVKFELSWRNVVDKETQQKIIDEVYKISHGVNIKIWLGIKWLSTYISIRPSELLNIKEGDFDLRMGIVVIPHPKEKKAKSVPLLAEDVELLRAMPRGIPNLFFFRHPSGLSGVRAGQRFGQKYLYKWWKKACGNLGIEDVDLYGGTRHSSARALREFCSPEEIRLATMHSTNKAFERYFQIELEDVRRIYGKTKADKNLTRDSGQQKKGNLLKLQP